jgi:hypothetical protein
LTPDCYPRLRSTKHVTALSFHLLLQKLGCCYQMLRYSEALLQEVAFPRKFCGSQPVHCRRTPRATGDLPKESSPVLRCEVLRAIRRTCTIRSGLWAAICRNTTPPSRGARRLRAIAGTPLARGTRSTTGYTHLCARSAGGWSGCPGLTPKSTGGAAAGRSCRTVRRNGQGAIHRGTYT